MVQGDFAGCGVRARTQPVRIAPPVAQNTGAIRAVIIGEAEIKTHLLYDFIGGIVRACQPRLAGIIVRVARFAQFTVIGWGVALELA